VLRELSKRQRPPNFRFEVPTGPADSSRQLTALAEARPAGVLIIAGAEDSARLARGLRDLCVQKKSGAVTASGPRLFGSQSMGRTRFRELAGSSGEDARFPVLAHATPEGAVATQFIKRFNAEHPHPPDYTALLTYDATRLLLQAIRQAGPNRARVRTALAGLSPWQGIAGTISFDGTGQNTRTNIQMATLRNGRIELCSSLADRDLPSAQPSAVSRRAEEGIRSAKESEAGPGSPTPATANDCSVVSTRTPIAIP
jgi:branched-chain amino acid transport system substrate-binding protein